MVIRKSLGVCGLLLFAVLTSPLFAQTRGKFACEAEEGLAFTDDGMRAEPQFKRSKEIGLESFHFDENTGEFVWPELGLNIAYRVLQYGGTVNGIVAVALRQGPKSHSAKTLRIATWSPVGQGLGRRYPFMLIDEDRVITGFCQMAL